MKKIYDFYFPEWDNHFENFFNKDRGYQEAQRNRAFAHVVEFEVAVDCGAHVGLWSRDLSVFFDKLYCFEPVKEFFECLKSNILSKNVEFYNSALGKEFSQGEILITKNSGNSGQTHLIKDKKKQYENYQKLKLEMELADKESKEFKKIPLTDENFEYTEESKK